MIYIYTLAEPLTGEIRYVGKTENLKRRFSQHICIKSGHKRHSKAWIKSLLDKNLLPTMEVLDVCLYEDQNWIEIYWISQIKSWGFNLTNLTEGGEGLLNYKHDAETIEKIRQAGIGRKPTQVSIDALVFYNKFNRTKEHSLKQSKAMLGKTPPNKGIPMSENQKKLLSEIKKGVPLLKGRITIIQLTLNGNFIKEWNSATEAAQTLNLSRANIVACLKGRRNKCGNYVWVYKTEDIVQPQLKD